MIECGSRNLTAVPPEIPMDATTVHLDGNALGTVLTEIFLGRTRLALLFLNSTALTAVTNRTFLGLRALKRLHLEHNRLTDLSWPALFPDSPGLEELYLHHNRLRVLGRDTLAGLAGLRILTLHNNQLASLAPESLGLAQLPALRTVTSGKNPWNCSCELALTVSRLGLRSGLEQVTCSPPSAAGRGPEPEPILRYMQTACRELDVLPVSSPADDLPPLLVLAVCSLAGGVVTLLVAAGVLLAHRHRLTRWIHARKASGPAQKVAADDDSQYSPMIKVSTAGSPCQFVSPTLDQRHVRTAAEEHGMYLHYCLADDDYVRELLAPRLAARCEKSLRLCLHHRDLRAAATVGEAITEAVRLSDCLLILASSAYFLSSVALCELQLILSAAMARFPSFIVIVAVPPPQGAGGAPAQQARSQLAALLGGGLTQNWTFLATADPLFYQRVTITLQQQRGRGGRGGNLPSLSSTSTGSSCSTRSTGVMSGSLPPLPRTAELPRIIPNPLADHCSESWEEAVYSTVADLTGTAEDDLSYQTVYTDQFFTLQGGGPRPPGCQPQQLQAGGGSGSRFRTLK